MAAAAASLLEEDLTCPVCYKLYEDPLLLACSHSVCRPCLQQWRLRDSFRCPVCRQQNAAQPHRNLALKNLCEAYAAEQRREGRRGRSAEHPEETQRRRARTPARADELCPLHHERYKLFCLEDEEPLCVVCQTSEKHWNHTLRPAEEAAQTCKEKIRADLQSMDKNMKALEKAKLACERTERSSKIKVESTEKKIRAEFDKLYRFLGNEEEARISAMKKEARQNTNLAKRTTEDLTDDIESLSSMIAAMEQDLKAKDVALLKNYKDTKRRAQFIAKKPGKVPEEINVDQHLCNLKDRVLGRMTKYFQNQPAQARDRATTHPAQAVPDQKNQKRYNNGAPEANTAAPFPSWRSPGKGLLRQKGIFSPHPRPIQPAMSVQSLPVYVGNLV